MDKKYFEKMRKTIKLIFPNLLSFMSNQIISFEKSPINIFVFKQGFQKKLSQNFAEILQKKIMSRMKKFRDFRRHFFLANRFYHLTETPSSRKVQFMTGNTSLRTLLYQFVNENPSLRTYYISL